MAPKRVDSNQAELMAEARRLGAEVQSIAPIGHGCPDLLGAQNGHWFMVEIKDGSKPPSKRKLNERQVEWHKRFNAPVWIWESVEDVRRDLIWPKVK